MVQSTRGQAQGGAGGLTYRSVLTARQTRLAQQQLADRRHNVRNKRLFLFFFPRFEFQFECGEQVLAAVTLCDVLQVITNGQD